MHFKHRNGVTVLDNLFQSGCLRAHLLRTEPGHSSEAVLLNTAGGLTGGDRLSMAISWGPLTHATVTTQACEKLYRAAAGEARIDTTLNVHAGARAEWLPQETILFDRAALRRDLQVRIAPGSVFTGLEATVLGRTAMGEVVSNARFTDQWRIWRGAQLIYADAFALGGDIPALIAKMPVTQDRLAFASLLHVSSEAEGALKAVRGELPTLDCITAASAWNGLLAIRFIANEGRHLRAAIVRVLNVLRESPLPRVWQI